MGGSGEEGYNRWAGGRMIVLTGIGGRAIVSLAVECWAKGRFPRDYADKLRRSRLWQLGGNSG